MFYLDNVMGAQSPCWHSHSVTQSCPTLCFPVDCSPPGSSVHGDSPGKNTGVGCHALLQGIFPTQGSTPGLPHGRRILYRLSHQRSLDVLSWELPVPGLFQELYTQICSQPRQVPTEWGVLRFSIWVCGAEACGHVCAEPEPPRHRRPVGPQLRGPWLHPHLQNSRHRTRSAREGRACSPCGRDPALEVGRGPQGTETGNREWDWASPGLRAAGPGGRPESRLLKPRRWAAVPLPPLTPCLPRVQPAGRSSHGTGSRCGERGDALPGAESGLSSDAQERTVRGDTRAEKARGFTGPGWGSPGRGTRG